MKPLAVVAGLFAATVTAQQYSECTSDLVRTDDCADVINPAACYNQFRWNSRTLACIEGTDDADRKRKILALGAFAAPAFAAPVVGQSVADYETKAIDNGHADIAKRTDKDQSYPLPKPGERPSNSRQGQSHSSVQTGKRTWRKTQMDLPLPRPPKEPSAPTGPPASFNYGEQNPQRLPPPPGGYYVTSPPGNQNNRWKN
ncbi:uncharacterized protein PpBr36_10760 [Pyricularia pennisetigena]|uniref:uncharacterized protein n=1 Tax=Pyricularia pennisetigena TaxID=1578925 RepID=UPI00114EFE88|nr:uncharacterized protein PpBr36_10760 [Pyricularia pennisetigena]TLS21022.1 hypothetical protein PpBr36_10760 [Pyricularia pennisetigena]